jgi:hypothetical protein
MDKVQKPSINKGYFVLDKKIKIKDIPVTGCGGPQGFETSRIPQFSRKSAHKWR